MTGVPDIYTVSLLHFDEADASTSFIDESGKIWTANGNAQIDTAQKKFGRSSGLFDGTTDWTDTPDHTDFDFASSDGTIDFWMRVDSLSAGVRKYICGQCDSALGDNSFYIYLDPVDVGGGLLQYYVRAVVNSEVIGVNVNSLQTGFFHHIALIKYGSLVNLWANASNVDDAHSIATINNSASKLAIGRAGEKTGDTFNGWIDEFRVSKGIARFRTGSNPPFYQGQNPLPVYPYGYFLPQITIG